MVTIYRDRIAEETKLWEKVDEYEIDLDNRVVKASNILGEKKEFAIDGRVRWMESDDSLII